MSVAPSMKNINHDNEASAIVFFKFYNVNNGAIQNLNQFIF